MYNAEHPRRIRTGKNAPVSPGSAHPKGTMSTSGTPKAKNVMGHGERSAKAKGVI